MDVKEVSWLGQCDRALAASVNDQTAKQRAEFQTVRQLDLNTGRAYHVKLVFRRFWTFRYPKGVKCYFNHWYFWATYTRLAPIFEGLTGKMKTALKLAYGFKTFVNSGTITYLIAGKLELPTGS